MKTIFRHTSVALLFATIIALGAVAGFAQAACDDTAGIADLDAKFRAAYPKKDVPGRQEAIDLGKQFLEKYGSCPAADQLSTYLKTQIPAMEKRLVDVKDKEAVTAQVNRFLAGMKSKNWDDVYSSGKQLLTLKPDEYRDVELVLGSIGLDETAKSPRVTKYNDDTLKYAKMALADLESGKAFKTFGVFVKDGANFQYKDKNDAIAWMNYTIGFILSADKNNKKEGVGYLYKASQAVADTKTNPVVFEWIGAYYFDDAKKLIGEVGALANEIKSIEESVRPSDTPEVKQGKLDAAKAKAEIFKTREGVLNGTVERALDAYSRAFTLAPDTPAGKNYRDSIRKTLGDLYNVRFEKTDGVDAYVKAAVAKPLPDPSSPIAPIIDPEPVTTTSSTTTAPATPAVTPAAKPAAPAAKPVAGIKPQAVVTSSAKTQEAGSTATAKPVVKKKGTR